MNKKEIKMPNITKIVFGKDGSESISQGENNFLRYLVITLVKIRTETIYTESNIKPTDNTFTKFILNGFDIIERQPEYNTISSIEKDILNTLLSLNSTYLSTRFKSYHSSELSGSTTGKILTYLKNNYTEFYNDFKHFVIETTELVNPTGSVNQYYDEVVIYPFIQVVDDTMTIEFIKTYPSNMTFKVDMEQKQKNRIDTFINAYTHPLDNEVNDHLNNLTHAMMLFASFNLPKFNTTNEYNVFELFSRENLLNSMNYLTSKKQSDKHLDAVKLFVSNLVTWDTDKLQILEREQMYQRPDGAKEYNESAHVSVDDIRYDKLVSILLRRDVTEIAINLRRLVIGISSTLVKLISERFWEIELIQVYNEINMYIIGKEIQNTEVLTTLLSKYNNVIDQESLIFNKEGDDDEDQEDVEPTETESDDDSKEEEGDPTEDESNVDDPDSDADEDTDINDSSDSNDDTEDDSGNKEDNDSSEEEDEEHTSSNVIQYEKDYGNIDNFLAKRRMYDELNNISLMENIDDKFVTCIREYLKYFIWIVDVSNTETLIKNLHKELKLK